MLGQGKGFWKPRGPQPRRAPAGVPGRWVRTGVLQWVCPGWCDLTGVPQPTAPNRCDSFSGRNEQNWLAQPNRGEGLGLQGSGGLPTDCTHP